MISVAEALEHCLSLVSPLPEETIALAQAAGRFMPVPTIASHAQPPFDASAMDGYAVAGDPQAGDSFTIVGEAGAGHPWGGTLAAGEALRIFTGAPLPAGATRVVIQEDVIRAGARITVKPGADSARHIRPAGQDFPAGFALSPRRLRPADLGLLAAMNQARVRVTRRPVIALIATGDELVMPGESPRPGQIIASNSFALKAMCEAEGAEVRLLPIARDTEAALHMVFGLARGADLVVTTGGASVGDHDLVGKVTQDLGMEQKFWKIAMRPGKPLMAGRLQGAAMLGLPGNPVSSVVCTHLFIRPMIRRMLGLPDAEVPPQARRAILGAAVQANGPRAHYMRARLAPDPAGHLPRITAFDRQDSALMTVLAEADCLLIRPVGDPERPAGHEVDYLPL